MEPGQAVLHNTSRLTAALPVDQCTARPGIPHQQQPTNCARSSAYRWTLVTTVFGTRAGRRHCPQNPRENSMAAHNHPHAQRRIEQLACSLRAVAQAVRMRQAASGARNTRRNRFALSPRYFASASAHAFARLNHQPCSKRRFRPQIRGGGGDAAPSQQFHPLFRRVTAAHSGKKHGCSMALAG